MLRLSLLLVVLTHPIRTAYVTNSPSFAARLDRFYEKLESITFATPKETTTESKLDQWEHKLQKLDSISMDNLSDEDEDLLAAVQSWGQFSPDQLDGMAKELQSMRDDREDDRSDRFQDRFQEQDYIEMGENDEEYADEDYHNDGKEDEEDEDVEATAPSPRPSLGVTPSAYTRDDPFRQTIVSAVDPIAATNERPRILNDETLTPLDRMALRQAAMDNMKRVMKTSKCMEPQPRWFLVRHLAPAADTVYMPPCVELHRCAPDSGCCNNEADVCAPIDGKHVTISFYLHKADATMSAARMLFFNHTKCACVSRDTLQTTIRSRVRTVPHPSVEHYREGPREEPHPNQEPRLSEEPRVSEERQNDWHSPTELPKLNKEDEDATAPPQMRRCTCPGHFLASISETGPCSCVCEWPEASRRRDCLPLARGDEHFGLRDRVCVASGDCTPPACKYGAYDRKLGKCPARKFRRLRYHHSRRYQPEKTVVV